MCHLAVVLPFIEYSGKQNYKIPEMPSQVIITEIMSRPARSAFVSILFYTTVLAKAWFILGENGEEGQPAFFQSASSLTYKNCPLSLIEKVQCVEAIYGIISIRKKRHIQHRAIMEFCQWIKFLCQFAGYR